MISGLIDSSYSFRQGMVGIFFNQEDPITYSITPLEKTKRMTILDVTARSTHSKTNKLNQAIWLNQLDTVTEILKPGINSYAHDFALRLAVHIGRLNIVEKLLEVDEMPSIDLALAAAAVKGDSLTVDMFFKYSKKIKHWDIERALWESAEQGQLEIVRKLTLKLREIVKEIDNDDAWGLMSHYLGWAIESAAKNGQLEVVNYFLEESVDEGSTKKRLAAWIQDHKLSSAFLAAIQKGHIQTAAALLTFSLNRRSIVTKIGKIAAIGIGLASSAWSLKKRFFG